MELKVIDHTESFIALGKASLFILSTICVISLVLNRDRPQSRQKAVKTWGLIFLVIVVCTVFLIFKKTYFPKLQKHLFFSIPASVQLISDKYIINKVGEEYFQKNFVFNEDLSTKDHQNPNYYVHYDFFPLKQYNENATIQIIVFPNGGATEYTFGQPVPTCIKDATLCDFSLTHEEFLGIINKYSVQGDYLSSVQLNPPNLEVGICPSNKHLIIDYRTKTVQEKIPERISGYLISECVRVEP